MRAARCVGAVCALALHSHCTCTACALYRRCAVRSAHRSFSGTKGGGTRPPGARRAWFGLGFGFRFRFGFGLGTGTGIGTGTG
eukprot:scaffold97483_cov58-Phaeocystis_antarctica.AAC.6